MICTGASYVSEPLKFWVETYNNWYQLNLEIYKIWYAPFLHTQKDSDYDEDTISAEPDQDDQTHGS